MFKNDYLETLTHMHPATPWFIGVPVVLVMSFWVWTTGGVGFFATLGLLLLGLLVWTFFEYLMHRFVFHYEPKTAWGRRVHFVVHGVHHDYPNDASRLVMPPVLSVPLGVVVFLLLYGLFAAPVAPLVFIGIMIGYIAYDTLHFMAHHRPMRGPVGRALKRYHMRHHFADPQRGFGVSSPLWDYVFRTQPRGNKRPKTAGPPAGDEVTSGGR